MDSYIPLAQRQQSVPVASQIASAAESTRAQQLTSASLGTDSPRVPATKPHSAPAVKDSPQIAAADPGEMDSPATAGADYARPRVATSQAKAQPAPRPVVSQTAEPEPKPGPKPEPKASQKPARPASGPWRIQFGAFGVASNVDALWSKLAKRPELAGHPKIVSSAGRLTKLQAGGFASEADASTACSRLKSAGFTTCVPTRD
ncbi:SPOR domain-containing protein [Novosphingobium sp. 9]|uniref:SPOR domain-containing protein n=1 Tax=Novosphingobium sp. 9 TaxID=2025349 RepID=UPI0028CBA0EB|nr:SPOR domain-containing protein [Novosphingobium sp. 9]